MMEIIAYFLLLLMGATLGLVGAGGSILTIPILIYILKIPVTLATVYSIGIVGITSFVGAMRFINKVSFSKIIFFAPASIFGVYLSRSIILPSLPESFGIITLDKALILLLIISMFVSSYFMINDFKLNLEIEAKIKFRNIIKICIIGFSVGIVMGILGAGGGFLIVPALVFLLNSKMNEAVSSSLLIISMNSLVGFLADKHDFISSDWEKLISFSAIAIFGMYLGLKLNTYLSQVLLKKAFGIMVIFIAIMIFTKEFAAKLFI